MHRIIPELYCRVQSNNELNRRVVLDTHLLRIRSKNEQKPYSEKLVSRSGASVLIGRILMMSALLYITNALIAAEFKEMSNDEFKDSYLATLDDALKDANISDDFLSEKYKYPFGGAINREHDIQEYFIWRIASAICDFYRVLGSLKNYFGNPSIVRPPLDQQRIIQLDIIHIINESDSDMQYPNIVFEIGDYKEGNYELTQGFEELRRL